MADHKHGEMDIETHEKTFEGFFRATAWTVLAIFVILVFIAIVNA